MCFVDKSSQQFPRKRNVVQIKNLETWLLSGGQPAHLILPQSQFESFLEKNKINKKDGEVGPYFNYWSDYHSTQCQFVFFLLPSFEHIRSPHLLTLHYAFYALRCCVSSGTQNTLNLTKRDSVLHKTPLKM